MSTFRMSVEGKPDCLVLLYYTLRDLLWDSALPSEPITCKKATNRDLLTLFDLFKTSHDLLRLLFMGVARIFEGGGGKCHTVWVLTSFRHFTIVDC